MGDDACRSCHSGEVESFHQTAHFLTSSEPSEHSILGSFAPGDNLLKTANPSLTFQMEARNGAFYQNANSRSERFGFVIGSGEKGQTYLFWDGDQLFQLPVSYWKELGWVNSPGYRDGVADFERPIIPRCLECHATVFQSTPPPVNSYSHTGYELGIQCEKCHGPGREHVEREQSKTASHPAILNPAHFTRDQQMDLCAWCHAGQGQPLVPSFSYLPGETLENYISLPKLEPDTPLDVHGNQVELLKQSRCYLESSMTCLTCHNVHLAQHNLAEFSQHCLACHKPGSAVFSRPDHPVVSNCIDCHMPKQETNLIVFNSVGKQLKPEIRNHWIKVYPPPLSNKDTPKIP
ncbi:MAG TPA: multiheme c-type cytochrome [Acidobacteriaceae bacterium]|nr:multiheme c-type cytochrome [Acidobacteriaceae bacterium]